MGLIGLVILLIVIGVVLNMLKTSVPIEPNILILINLVIVIAVCLYILGMFGVVDLPVPGRIR